MYSIDRSFQRDFTRSDSTLFPAFIIILYAVDFNYLIRWIIVTYILLNISIAHSHATSAYECELFAVILALFTKRRRLYDLTSDSAFATHSRPWQRCLHHCATRAAGKHGVRIF